MSDATIAQLLAESPWAIRPDVLPGVVDAVRAHIQAGGDGEPEVAAEPNAATRLGAAGGTAVIPIRGVITPHPTLLGLIFGIDSSLGRLRKMVRRAVSDPDISAIVLDIDSPGGVVDGVPEMAAELRAARDRKPVVAVANASAASGAYWLASQATELHVTPSGDVGSIGVFGVHTDVSGLEQRLGVKTTLISAGKYKVEANPFEPLSDEARESIQQMVDAYYGMFVADVAKGRRVKEADVRGGFGEGRMVLAKPAVAAGMADRVGTVEDAIVRASRLTGGDRGRTTGALDLSKPWVRDLIRTGSN